MQSWLRHVACAWYAKQDSKPDATIQSIFEGPVVVHTWKVTRTDPELVRFGLLWKVFDLILKMSSGGPRALPHGDCSIEGGLDCWWAWGSYLLGPGEGHISN